MHTNIFRVLRLEDMTHGTVGIIPTKSANYENDKKFRKLSELWSFDKKMCFMTHFCNNSSHCAS